MVYCFWQPPSLPPSLAPSLAPSVSLLSHNIVKEQREPAGTCSLSERKDREALEGVKKGGVEEQLTT